MLDRVAFTLFGVWNVYWYGIFIAVALVIGIALMLYSAKKSGMDTDNTLDAVLLVVPLAIIFARAHYVIWSWNEFSFYPFPEILYRMVAAWDGGMAIYGGIIGGVIGVVIYARWKKVPFLTVLDWIVPGLALGQAIGRWGNWVNQEVYGHVVTNPALQWFPMSVWIDRTQEWHAATFFYESMGDLLIFLLLFFLIRRKTKNRGVMTASYFLMYGILRGCLEGLRSEEFIQSAPGFPVNQVLSFILAFLALIFLIYILKNKDKFPLYDRKTALEEARQAAKDEDEEEEDEPKEKKELGGFVIGGDDEEDAAPSGDEPEDAPEEPSEEAEADEPLPAEEPSSEEDGPAEPVDPENKADKKE